jgi:hypothetical protein
MERRLESLGLVPRQARAHEGQPTRDEDEVRDRPPTGAPARDRREARLRERDDPRAFAVEPGHERVRHRDRQHLREVVDLTVVSEHDGDHDHREADERAEEEPAPVGAGDRRRIGGEDRHRKQHRGSHDRGVVGQREREDGADGHG